ncbi:O-antigen ligase family protein [Salinarchaeum laminariae]|uniref:O-antigen ligase family protein n=1 Tax=Salinarchaeum laminariae TaxID=869888 RepID=UPI0020C12D66|nr:O-antigen ligase family protein [Salinarchaeum laminariae]
MTDRTAEASGSRTWSVIDPRSVAAPETTLAFGGLLTVLVIWLVPAVVVAGDVPPIPVLAIALGTYGLLAVATRSVVPSVVAAIPVLATVNADVPLLRGPERTVDLAVVIGDLAVVAGAVLLVLWLFETDASASIRTPRELLGRSWRTIGWPAAFLAGFAIWALLGAAFATHDPRTAAVFGLTQLRYVAYFVVAAGLLAVGYATLRSLTGAFVLAMIGHAAFALAQFANRGSLGVSTLGETPRSNELTIVLLGHAMPMGRFLGGLVGNNAAFVSLALPAVAVLVWMVADPDLTARFRLLALSGILFLGTFCVPLSQYDSAVLGFAVTIVLAVMLASSRYWPPRYRAVFERERPRLLGTATAAAVGMAVIVAVVGADLVLDVFPLVTGDNLETRLADYRRAYALALDHPLVGYGGGNVEPVAAEIGFSDDVAIHSIVYSHLAETGFVGLGLWLAAVFAIAVRAIRLAWSDAPDAAVATALCVGALGFLAIALLDQIWDNHTSMGAFWLFAGAIAGRYRAWTRDRELSMR